MLTLFSVTPCEKKLINDDLNHLTKIYMVFVGTVGEYRNSTRKKKFL